MIDESKPNSSVMPSRDYTILFVDDDKNICRVVSSIAEFLSENYFENKLKIISELVYFLKPDEMVEKHSNIDILITDCLMPGANGVELIEAYRNRFGERIMYSVLSGDTGNIKLPEGIPFLEKPIAAETLLNHFYSQIGTLESRIQNQ
jgi:CheY-like chemotaxis protein